MDSPEKGEVRPGIVVRVLGEGGEGERDVKLRERLPTQVLSRPADQSFSGADPGRAASRDRSGRVWENGEGTGERYSSGSVKVDSHLSGRPGPYGHSGPDTGQLAGTAKVEHPGPPGDFPAHPACGHCR